MFTFCFHRSIHFQEGSIGHELIIRPVPLEVSKSDDGSVHHVVYKRDNERQFEEQLSDFAYMEPDRLQKRYKRSTDEEESVERTRNKRSIPHIIYPEILVIVDYDGYRLHGGDNVQVRLEYQQKKSHALLSNSQTSSTSCRLNDILCHSGMESI